MTTTQVKEILKERTPGYKEHKKANPIEVRELKLYLENDADIYRQRLTPIYKNLQRKKARGIYHHDLAIKGMLYAVNDANKKYKHDFGYSFTTGVRYQVAKEMVKDFEAEYRTGNRY